MAAKPLYVCLQYYYYLDALGQGGTLFGWRARTPSVCQGIICQNRSNPLDASWWQPKVVKTTLRIIKIVDFTVGIIQKMESVRRWSHHINNITLLSEKIKARKNPVCAIKVLSVVNNQSGHDQRVKAKVYLEQIVPTNTSNLRSSRFAAG